jgi:hypothetical protein
MRDLSPPFRFDLGGLISSARRKLNTRIDGVSISLPFISFKVSPNDLEKRIAREIVIRVGDKRVLNASECCDNCIDQALESLQNIREFLVNTQVELSHAVESPLYLLIDFQLEAIRQFLTFEQRLNAASPSTTRVVHVPSEFRRPPDQREQYFAALEMLRAHLYRCLAQVSKIANTPIPKIAEHMRYDEAWQLKAYEEPPLPEDGV